MIELFYAPMLILFLFPYVIFTSKESVEVKIIFVSIIEISLLILFAIIVFFFKISSLHVLLFFYNMFVWSSIFVKIMAFIFVYIYRKITKKAN